MKKLALIALIMVLGLSGCASSGMSGLIKEDWTEFWNDPGSGDWELIKWDWTEFWNSSRVSTTTLDEERILLSEMLHGRVEIGNNQKELKEAYGLGLFLK